jgi:hypothetical protein
MGVHPSTALLAKAWSCGGDGSIDETDASLIDCGADCGVCVLEPFQKGGNGDSVQGGLLPLFGLLLPKTLGESPFSFNLHQTSAQIHLPPRKND